jgi:hypothetical protein
MPGHLRCSRLMNACSHRISNNLISTNASLWSYMKTMAIAANAVGRSRQNVWLFLLGPLQGGDDAIRRRRLPSFGSLEFVALIAEQR